MTIQVALRNSQPSDEDFFYHLYADSHPEFGSLPLPPQALAELLQMQRRAQLAQYQTRYPDAVDQVIEVEGSATGRCWVHRDAHEHRLLDIAVLSSWQRLGIGRAVLNGLCQQAARAGVPLRLSVWQANSNAQRLYAELGFRAESELNGYLNMIWTTPGRTRGGRSLMSEQPMTYEVFAELLNQPFTLHQGDNSDLEVKLLECVASQADGGPPSFSLTFKAGPDAPIEQATYLLSADGFGPAPIFLVPIRRLPDGLEYQAVFTN